MRGLAFLVGAFLTLFVLVGGSAFFAGAPDSAIRGPSVHDGSVR